MSGLVLDPRFHLAVLIPAVVLGVRAAAEAIPADPLEHGGNWLCCPVCSQGSPPPAPARWLGAAWSRVPLGRG